ncbi:protease HtpX [Leptospira sp. 2 VSF19]|uniref:Protease HtpX homolog n=1 Tax=Leptospira soteropolitanensis TaxID=2950025 RepID=A0AAW5VJJ3_9LEPT|nr:protease HtpX [Leptospira soteropolitanensis]MCW7492455.1 protease HtpX [Leptospira soteropolitanensis]MCW7500506.1 protease HtpX [Leptospira soteropolitanensis]MCW7522824.1 protease HtpX [Leptospira soteropolitanensis]MCW7526683.1 protease HtpX [Leptospira soteropolitanensis]MCW7530476.1 protease HtpX [Leptospira soteropolitanensis]
MTWIKRIGFFLLTNILIMTTISIVTTLLGSMGFSIRAYGLDLTQLIVFCLMWGMAGSFISLLLSKMMAKWTMGVKVIDPKKASAPEMDVYRRVQSLAQRAHLPMPEVGIYESPEVNAFATGPSKSSALVAVSSGLLNRMNAQELEGVLAHELSHVANGDMVTLTLIQGVVNSFAMFFSRIIAYIASNAVKEEMAHIVRIVVTIALDIVFSILGSMAVAYFSRQREFRADAGGAKLAGRESMISALESLRQMVEMPEDPRGEALASLKISSNKGGFLSLFATHPALEERILALKQMR